MTYETRPSETASNSLQIKRLEHLMISSADFTVSLLGGVGRFCTATAPQEGPQPAGRGEADGIVSGRSHGRQRAVFMSATGQSAVTPFPDSRFAGVPNHIMTGRGGPYTLPRVGICPAAQRTPADGADLFEMPLFHLAPFLFKSLCP